MPDPTPIAQQKLKQRFWRIFRLLALLSAIVSTIAALVIARGEPDFHIHLLVATALGIFFTMLVGTTLMMLVFLSASSGHDEAAGEQPTNFLNKDD